MSQKRSCTLGSMCNMKQCCLGQFRLVDIEVILILNCSRHQPLSYYGQQGSLFHRRSRSHCVQRKTLSKEANPTAQGGQHRLGDAAMKDSRSSQNNSVNSRCIFMKPELVIVRVLTSFILFLSFEWSVLSDELTKHFFFSSSCLASVWWKGKTWL